LTKDAIPKLNGPTPAIPSSTRMSITSCRARNSTSGVENSDKTDETEETDETQTTEPGWRSSQDLETECPAGKNTQYMHLYSMLSITIRKWFYRLNIQGQLRRKCLKGTLQFQFFYPYQNPISLCLEYSFTLVSVLVSSWPCLDYMSVSTVKMSQPI
jgi:hypothetical protein